MKRMPLSVAAAVALAVALIVEAAGLLGYFAYTAREHGTEGAGVFIGGVLLLIHAGRFVAGAVHRIPNQRSPALRKASLLALVAAIVLGVASREESVPRNLLAGIAAGLVAPLALIALLLLTGPAREWFAPPPAPDDAPTS